MRLARDVIILLATVDIAFSLIPNVTKIHDIENDLKRVETRRRKRRKKIRSTSSSEGALGKSSSMEDKESLDLTSRDTSSSTSENKKKPQSSVERTGWRKWHRKCQACPEDMAKKWRDPSIKWICGGYQRARRTFKSRCMMHYRNCQDGTMFVIIHEHRCENDTPREPRPHGVHFFYDYKVALSQDSSRASSGTSESEDSSDF